MFFLLPLPLLVTRCVKRHACPRHRCDYSACQASLGLDEVIAHLLLRAQNAMLASCSAGGCGHWVLPVVIACWAASSVATVWWLRVVFRRYETTVALPVE